MNWVCNVSHRTGGWTLFVFWLLIMLGDTGYAGSSDIPSFTLDACIETALQKNPVIAQARRQADASKERVMQARSDQYPEVSIGATGGYISEQNRMGLDDMTVSLPGMSPVIIPGKQMEIGANEKADLFLSLTQPVYTGGRIQAGIKKASAGMDIACHQVALEENKVRHGVTVMFFQLAKAKAYRQVVKTSLDQIKRHLEDAENMLDQGMLLQSDIHPINIRRLDTELMLVKADNDVARSMAALAERMGMPPDTEIPIVVDWDKVPPWPIPDEFLVNGGVRHEREIVDKQIVMASSDIEIAQGKRKPEVGFNLSGHYGYPGFASMDPDWDRWWQAGVNVSFTLFDMGGNQHGENAARMEKNRLMKTKDAVDHQISLDQINARLAYEETCRNRGITREKVLAAEENYRLKQDNFKVGMATNTDFLDAHTELVKAKTEQVMVAAETRIAWSAFLRAMGRDGWPDKEKENGK